MRATTITTALESLAADVTALGIPATLDPASIQLPGAWVALDAIEVLYQGEVALTAKVHLVAIDSGGKYALTSLTESLEKLLATNSPLAAPKNVLLDALTLPALGAAIPTITLTYEME